MSESRSADDLPENPPEQTAADEKAALQRAADELDLKDEKSILYFGARAQRALSRITDKMARLAAAGGPDAAARDMDAMLGVLREFKPSGGGWLGRLFGSARRRLIAQTSELLTRIDNQATALERHKTVLLTEVVSLDRLIEKCRASLAEVALYEKALRQARQVAEPAAQREVLARSEDLALSHQIGQQTLATLLMGQQASQDLLSRVNAVLEQTLPAWQVHFSQVLALWRGDETARALDETRGLTDELGDLGRRLRDARAEVARELSRGRLDLKALDVANEALAHAVGEGVELARQAESAVKQITAAAGSKRP
ncbi:MAG: toxic anion resistance protein [Pseudomonadota bacterium]